MVVDPDGDLEIVAEDREFLSRNTDDHHLFDDLLNVFGNPQQFNGFWRSVVLV